jgi:N-acetylneuraminic acid mutarotase
MLDGRLYVFGGHFNEKIQTTDVVQVYDASTNSWSRKAPLPVPTTHWNAVLSGHTVWFAGGFVGDHPGPTTTAVWRYDASSDRWTRGPALPAERGGGILFLADGDLHYAGGFLADRRTDAPEHWRLPLGGRNSAWTRAAPMPNPRGQLAGVVIDGLVYAIGGQLGHDSVPLDVALSHRYDPASDRWSERAPLPHPVSHAEPSTGAVDGRILVVGGRNNRDPRENPKGLLASVLLYDPPTNTWISLDELPHPLSGPAAVMLGSDLVVSGGGQGAAELPSTETWALPFRDAWRPRPQMPEPLGEVAAGVVGKHLYVVGEGTPVTQRYDLSRAAWTPAGQIAVRPFPGHHHASEVVDGRLYLFGGFDAAGRTQIYDPAVNRWRLGASMPFAAASSASAVINGKVYLAGGIVGDSTTSQAAEYDPATDRWRIVASMPAGRNHAASATDGRRMYVFGGRGKGSGDRNEVANGYADVQIYEPATDTWRTSADPGAGIAPLPQARGGMGKAVYLGDEFYVLGGETLNGPGATATGVYARVDIYDPRANRWHGGRDMPVPRHGMFPVAAAGRIFVAGGGTAAGASYAAVLDVYAPPGPVTPRAVSARAARTPPARSRTEHASPP